MSLEVESLMAGIEKGKAMNNAEPIKYCVLPPKMKSVIFSYFKPLAANVINFDGDWLNGLKLEFDEFCPEDGYYLMGEKAYRQYGERRKAVIRDFQTYLLG